MSGIVARMGTLPALVISLCFASGLNTYAMLLSLGVMARLGWVALPTGLGVLDDRWMIGVCGFLFFGEFVADKIPGFDVIWNLLHTFIRIPAAAVVAFTAASPLSPEMRAVVTVLGVGVAALAHGSKTALRVAVLPSPEAFSNVSLSLAEDGVAVGLSWIAVEHPVVGGAVVMGMMVAAVGTAWWGMRLIREGWNRRFRDRRRSQAQVS